MNGSESSQPVWRRASVAFVLATLLLFPLAVDAKGSLQSTVAVSALPAEARATLDLIHKGGPFPYPRDGVVFNNREHILPARARGYYHEYTVRTPGVMTRGAQRIVCGGAVAALSECYYSDDHYQSFRKIQP
jgi:ribonuclease T1